MDGADRYGALGKADLLPRYELFWAQAVARNVSFVETIELDLDDFTKAFTVVAFKGLCGLIYLLLSGCGSCVGLHDVADALLDGGAML